MDDLLIKNLANIFLPESSIEPEEVKSSEFIPIHSHKIIKESIFIRTIDDTFSSKIDGLWQNKPVFYYNSKKYALLENSKRIVSLDYYGVSEESIEKFEYFEPPLEISEILEDSNNIINISEKESEINSKLFNAVQKIINKQKVLEQIKGDSELSEELNLLNSEYDNTALKLSEKLTQLLKTDARSSNDDVSLGINNYTNENYQESSKFAEDFKKVLTKAEKIVEKEPEEKIEEEPVPKTAEYMPKEEQEATSKEEDGKPEQKSIEEMFWSFFESNKTDKRIQRFLSNQLDVYKKEIYQLTEKFTKENRMAMESGGGTNAVQYANGGTMNGSLTVTGDLTVSGTINGSTSGGGSGGSGTKSIHIIGNGIDNVYQITHSLNTKDLIIQAYDNTTDELIFCQIKNDNLNQTTITFQSPIANNSVKIIAVAYTSKKVFTVGDGVNNEYILTHNLNTKDLLVQAYDNVTDDVVLISFKNISLSESKVIFATPIAIDSMRVVISG